MTFHRDQVPAVDMIPDERPLPAPLRPLAESWSRRRRVGEPQ